MLKKITLLVSILLLFTINTLANGICIVDASTNTNLTLISSSINISVESQISITKSTQTFSNNFSDSKSFKYAFPLNRKPAQSVLGGI